MSPKLSTYEQMDLFDIDDNLLDGIGTVSTIEAVQNVVDKLDDIQLT